MSRDLHIITVPLGEGKVGVGNADDQDGIPGIMLRALKNPIPIGEPNSVQPDNVENFGVFVRCGNLESAKVLLRAVNKLIERLEIGGGE